MCAPRHVRGFPCPSEPPRRRRPRSPAVFLNHGLGEFGARYVRAASTLFLRLSTLTVIYAHDALGHGSSSGARGVVAGRVATLAAGFVTAVFPNEEGAAGCRRRPIARPRRATRPLPEWADARVAGSGSAWAGVMKAHGPNAPPHPQSQGYLLATVDALFAAFWGEAGAPGIAAAAVSPPPRPYRRSVRTWRRRPSAWALVGEHSTHRSQSTNKFAFETTFGQVRWRVVVSGQTMARDCHWPGRRHVICALEDATRRCVPVCHCIFSPRRTRCFPSHKPFRRHRYSLFPPPSTPSSP